MKQINQIKLKCKSKHSCPAKAFLLNIKRTSSHISFVIFQIYHLQTFCKTFVNVERTLSYLDLENVFTLFRRRYIENNELVN